VIELFPELLIVPEREAAIVHGDMRPDHRLVCQFAKRIDRQKLAGDVLASPVIAFTLENPKQPRRRLAPQIVQCAAVVFEPIGESGIVWR
jgi:hypothetical protein